MFIDTFRRYTCVDRGWTYLLQWWRELYSAPRIAQLSSLGHLGNQPLWYHKYFVWGFSDESNWCMAAIIDVLPDCDAVMEWMVVMIPSTMPKFASITYQECTYWSFPVSTLRITERTLTLASGARQLVVHDALETTLNIYGHCYFPYRYRIKYAHQLAWTAWRMSDLLPWLSSVSHCLWEVQKESLSSLLSASVPEKIVSKS